MYRNLMAGAAALAVVLPALVVVVPVAEAATAQGFRAAGRQAAPVTFRQNQAPGKPISSAPPRQYLAPSKPFTPMISKQAPGRQVSPMPSQQKPVLSPSSQRATGPSPGVLSPGRDLSRLTAQPKPAMPSASLNGPKDAIKSAMPIPRASLNGSKDAIKSALEPEKIGPAPRPLPVNPILEPPNIVLDQSNNSKLKPPVVPPAPPLSPAPLPTPTPVPPPTKCFLGGGACAPIPTPVPTPTGDRSPRGPGQDGKPFPRTADHVIVINRYPDYQNRPRYLENWAYQKRYVPTQEPARGSSGATVVSRPVVAAATPTCLTKEYLQPGIVLFKDVCTKQFAMNSTEVADQVVSAASRGCLTKDNLENGAVLFKDVCTKEWAMNPPAEQAR